MHNLDLFSLTKLFLRGGGFIGHPSEEGVFGHTTGVKCPVRLNIISVENLSNCLVLINLVLSL